MAAGAAESRRLIIGTSRMGKSDAKNLKIFLSYSRADREVVQPVEVFV
jgi:hypothetical protein